MLILFGRSSGPVRFRARALTWCAFLTAALSGWSAKLFGQVAVNASVNPASVLGIVPENALALHASVYANQFTNTSLDDRLIEAGTQMLRYSGGNYSQIFHFSVPPVAPHYRTCCGTLPDVTKPHPLTPDKGPIRPF